jgi:GntR family transcriptional regulator of arabinose operon
MANKYDFIIRDINNKINSGFFKLSDQLPTEMEMTKIYNVSRITIQKALGILVNEGIVDRTPGKGSFIKSVPPSRKINEHIHFIFINSAKETITMYNEADKVLSNSGYKISIQITNDSLERESEIVKRLISTNAKGIIIYPVFDEGNNDLFEELINSNFPIVFVDRHPSNLPCSCVMSNGYLSSFMSVEHLVKAGHKKIAFLSHDLEHFKVIKDRFKGYVSALKRFGLEYDEKYVFHPSKQSDNSEQKGRQHDFELYVKRILKMADKPTAIICSNDINAIDCIHYANQLGLKVPKDISIIGHDDIEVSSKTSPPLTTIKQPYELIGETAAKLLIDMIEKNDKNKYSILLAPSLIERKSVLNMNK